MGCTRAAVVASLLGWTVLLAASLPRPALSATGLPQIGATVSNAVALGRRQVPLPAGEWSIVAADFGSVEGLSPGPYGAILDVTLVQLRDARVESMVIARTNALPVAAGWGPAGACMRRDLPYVSELRIQAYNLSCAYVEPIGLANPSMESSALSQSAREFIAARGWSLPPTLLIAGFRIGNRRDVLDVRYGFDPKTAPFAVADAAERQAWQPDAIARDPARSRLIAALAGWSDAVGKRLEQRLGHPAAGPEPLLPPWQMLTASSDAGDGRRISLWEVALYKDLTFRAIMMSSSAALTYFISGSLFSAGMMPVAQGITHFLAFYGVELGWEWPRHPPVQEFVASTRRPAMLAASRLLQSTPAAAAPGGAAVARYAGFDGMQVPLPPGQWEVAATARDGEGAAAVDSTVLVNLAGARLAGIVMARTNAKDQTATFGATAECDRNDIHLAVHRYATRVDGLCVFVKHVVVAPRASDVPGWTVARRWLESRGIEVAGTWLAAGFRLRDQTHMLDIRYYFPPPDGPERPAALSWGESVWSASRMPGDAARRAHVEAVVRWTRPMGEAIERGFRDQLDAGFEPVSPWAVPAAVFGVAELDALRATGAIDAAHYHEQLMSLQQRAAAPEPVETSFARRTLYKTLTYQAVASADTAAVSYLILGAPFQSLAYTAAISVWGPTMYYVHELAWNAAGVGKPPMQAAREFAEIGIDR